MLYENVFSDDASQHQIDEMVQSEYLSDFVRSLKGCLGSSFSSYQFYIFSVKHTHSRMPPASIHKTGDRNVLIFLSDESGRVPVELRPHYHAIFKTHLKSDPGGNIYPLALGFANGIPEPVIAPVADRSIDLFFSGNLNPPRYGFYQQFSSTLSRLPDLTGSIAFNLLVRSPFAKMLKRSFAGHRDGLTCDVTFTNGFRQGLSPVEYGMSLLRAKVALCPKGFMSTESFRHSEALRAGCVVVSEPLSDTDIYRGAPFVIVENWQEGLARAAELVHSPEKLAELQRRGLEWFSKRLSASGSAHHVAASLLALNARDPM